MDAPTDVIVGVAGSPPGGRRSRINRSPGKNRAFT
jgi:hypothetical protein